MEFESSDLIIDEDETILREDELEWIKKSDKIMELLNSKRLQEILKWIDQSKYPWRSLDWEMMKNEHFWEFAYLLLEEIGYGSNSI